MNWWRLRQKIHSSWLICAASVGVVCGVVAVQYVPQGWFASAIWLMVAVGLMVVCLWSRWMAGVLMMLIVGGVLGLWRGAVLDMDIAPYRQLVAQQVEVSGLVKEDADRDKSGALVLRLADIDLEGRRVAGTIWVTLGGEAVDIKRGDRVTVKGKMTEGFGSFSGAMYRVKLQRVARPEPGDVARRVRDDFADRIRQVISEPASSLGLGYLLGQRRGLPEELSTALQVAGLTHIVVASGYNLTILVRLARRLFVKVSKYLATLSASAMILGFVAITGMSPSISRAGLVTGLALLAWYYGRRFHPLVLLSLAAAITLLINPTYGWGDLGWQLSFAAFGGVMILAPLLQRYFFGEQKPGVLRQILGETVAAFVVTLPILLAAFGQVSLVAVIANLLVLPLVPLAMLLVFLTGLAVVVMPPIGSILGALATWLLQYMIWVAEALAGVPWALLEVHISPSLMGVGYMVIIAACLYMWRSTRYSLRDTNLVE